MSGPESYWESKELPEAGRVLRPRVELHQGSDEGRPATLPLGIRNNVVVLGHPGRA